MRVPHIIPQHVLQAYRCSVETTDLVDEIGRTIRSENDKWDEFIIPDLTTLAMRVIVQNWSANPILESLPTCSDKDTLIELLPIDLPFDLIIRHIPYEYYWKRSAQSRWKYCNLNEHGNSWRQLYCERHFNEYLQQLDPKNVENDSSELLKLIEDSGKHIFAIEIRSLIPNKVEFEYSEEDDEDSCTAEKLPVHHIPFGVILPRLSNLRELCINIGMIYMDDGFEWRDFEFSIEDCLNLGSGINECRSLKKLSLTRSNLDQPRAAALLQKMIHAVHIQEIDFSHCTLGNSGALAVSGFLTSHNGLRDLNLTNNNIGAEGFGAIAAAITSNGSLPLKRLNLRLNPLGDQSRGHISELIRKRRLEYLNLSGCNLGPDVGFKIVNVISIVKPDNFLLDVSNNLFDAAVGRAFELASKSCTVIVQFNSRMCRISKEEI